MKRLAVSHLLVSILLAFGLISACAKAPAATEAPTAPAIVSTTQPPAEPTTSAPTEAPAKKVKVAMMMIVSCDDTGWGQPACEGLKEAQDLYGVDITISENVQIADAPAAMRDYAERGYNLIIGHGFQYSDPANTVAPDYPNTMFAILYGGNTGTNLVAIDPKTHELAYLAGIIAGSMTKTNKIGFVGGQVLPGIVRLQEGYRQGAQAVNPDIQVLSVLDVGWDDVQAGKEATEALIQSGADVFWHDASFPGEGMIQAAAEHHLYSMGYGTCQDNIAPDYVLTSTIDGIKESMKWIVKTYLDGNLTGGFLHPGTSDGIFSLCPYNSAVPQDVRDRVAQAQKDIASGALTVNEVLELPK
jgi:basic membrane protein A